MVDECSNLNLNLELEPNHYIMGLKNDCWPAEWKVVLALGPTSLKKATRTLVTLANQQFNCAMPIVADDETRRDLLPLSE